jgi:hypothetical protein
LQGGIEPSASPWTRELTLARGDNASEHGRRRLTIGFAREVRDGHGLHLGDQIDAIQQRA